MSEQTLIRALEKIKVIVDEALGSKSKPVRRAKVEKKGGAESNSSSALPDHIIGLHDNGFMKQPKTALEVHTKLQSTYHCDSNRVAVALLRLHKKRALRKTSKTAGKRKQVAYVW
jgi:hypothetical protein